MNIYDLPVNTVMKRVKDGVLGKITQVHPPENYRYRWYTVLMNDGKRHYVHTWDIPKHFEVVS